MKGSGNNTIEDWLLYAAPNAMLIVDRLGRILQANTLAEALFGYDKGKLKGQSVESLIPEPLRETHRQHRKQYSEHLQTRPMGTGLRLRALRRDGTEFDVEIGLSPISTDTGSVVMAAIRDVTTFKHAHEMLQRAVEELERSVEAKTAELLKVNSELNKQVAERIQAETARQVAEEGYRHLVETQPDLICRFLSDTTLTFVNAAYAEFFGSTTEELEGKRFADFLTEKERNQVYSNLEACTLSQPSRQYERITQRADGAYRIHLWNDLAFYDEQGQIIDFQSVGVDITDRKEAEVKQRAIETKYKHLVEAIPLAMHIYRLEHDGRLVLIGANPAANNIINTDYAQILGQTIERAFAPFAEESLAEIFRHVAREGCQWHRVKVKYEYGDISGVYEVYAFQTAPNEIAVLFSDITDRSRYESTLAENARQMAAILDNIPDIAWLKDARSSFIAVNEPFGRACGVSPKDLVGKNDLDIWPKELAYSYRADDQEVMCTGKRKRVEERLMTSDGRESWIETIKTPIINDQGKVIGTTGIARDVTERKRVETSLRESEERFRQIAENIREVFYVSDLSKPQMLYISPGYETIWGRSCETLLEDPLSFLDCVHSDDREQVSQSLDRQRRGEKTELTYRIIRPDGSVRWIWDRAFPVRNKTGRIYRVTGIAEDITERKLAEQALYEEKERAQVTLHSIGDAVITTDFEGRIEYLNPVAEMLTGWTTDEARNLFLATVFRVIDEDTRKPTPDPVDQCILLDKSIGPTDHSILIRRDNQEIDVESSAAPIKGRDGKVIGAILVFHDVTEKRRLARQMAHDAAHDALTGLVNRREFERRLARALANAREHLAKHALCYLDLDQFKIINDTAGHAAGDELLKRVNNILAGAFRERDTLARLGGDEFGLLLEHCPLDEALRITHEAVERLRTYQFIWGQRSFQIGASVGIVAITAQCESIGQLLSQADIACYTAKEQGRDRVYVYEHENSEPAQRHSELLRVSSLKDALAADRFRLYFQPIRSLLTRQDEPSRFELLLRLLDDDDQPVLPDTFIPAAERYRLMVAIDRWVIQTAFANYDEWFGESAPVVSINLSGNSLNDDSLSAFLETQFSTFSLAPQCVCFEVTETAVIHNLGQATEFMQAMRERGSTLALDDFGCGLSSFRYLKSLPVDFLKIDGSFVKDMLKSDSDHAMVRAINDVGHAMGIKTIAEYACCPAIVDELRKLGIDYAQGYAIGAPATV